MRFHVQPFGTVPLGLVLEGNQIEPVAILGGVPCSKTSPFGWERLELVSWFGCASLVALWVALVGGRGVLEDW